MPSKAEPVAGLGGTRHPAPMPHIVLIDGPNYVYRAYHAIRGLSSSKGQPTNAIYGYVQMLQAVMRELIPSHAAVCFDPKGGSFRNHDFPEYKANRPAMPEDLESQWPYIWEITKAYGIPLLCVEGFEADDLIATLAQKAASEGWKVTIVSSDKDLLQLIGPNVEMLDTMRGTRFNPDSVKEKWGVPPEKIRDLLALCGDASDNIPGVPGIGAKTAAQLIARYGSLEAVLEHAKDIPQKKRREALIQHKEDARLSYALIGLRTDAPLPIESLEDLALREPDEDRLRALFSELEFRRLIAKLKPASNLPHPSLRVTVVDTPKDLDAMMDAIEKAELVAVDLETTSLRCRDAQIVGIAVSTQEGEGWYIPIGHREGKQLQATEVLQRLAPFFRDAKRKKCGHNLKYDLQVLWGCGLELAGIRYDSMLLAYCLHPGKYIPKLDDVAIDHLKHRCIHYEEVAGKGSKQVNFAEVPIEKAAPYAAEDAEVALRLCKTLSQKLDAEGRLQRHDAIELPLMRVLACMEWRGVKVDREKLAALSKEFATRIARIEEAVHASVGETFNIHSPKQLGEILFDKLRLPYGKRTKSGAWATGQEVLEKLAPHHPVPKLILEARQLAKLKSTYCDALQRLIHPATGRVHTSYNQAITSTGRLSSSDPNLQNIPIRTPEGRRIREAFVPEEGCVLISADYSQIELRLMAHFSQDASLIEAFRRGEDIHALTASAVHGVPVEEVDGTMRRHAKIINFGLMYGMGPFGLSKQLDIDPEEAERFIAAYFARYPGVRAFIDATLDKARRDGYVETLLGHRVYVPEIRSKNGLRRQYAERTAINAPLQGSAADIIKVAMLRLHERLRSTKAHMILQVHDELVIEAPADDAAEIAQICREAMSGAVSLSVPLIVDIGIGRNWYAAHPL